MLFLGKSTMSTGRQEQTEFVYRRVLSKILGIRVDGIHPGCSSSCFSQNLVPDDIDPLDLLRSLSSWEIRSEKSDRKLGLNPLYRSMVFGSDRSMISFLADDNGEDSIGFPAGFRRLPMAFVATLW